MVSTLEIPVYPEHPYLTEWGFWGTWEPGFELACVLLGRAAPGHQVAKSISFCLQYLNTENSNQAVASPQKELANMKILKSKSFLP